MTAQRAGSKFSWTLYKPVLSIALSGEPNAARTGALTGAGGDELAAVSVVDHLLAQRLARGMGEGLFELRRRRRSRIGRAFDCDLVGKRVVAVLAFVKKTQQTPEKELALARKRMQELKNG